MFEIFKPANCCFVYLLDYRFHACTIRPFGFQFDLIIERPATLPAWPSLGLPKMIAEKIKAFFLTVNDLRLFRVQG